MRNGRTLMIVVAHPDDDAYGMSGSIALHSDEPAFRFVLVHATDGGQGDLAAGFAATRDTLGAVRREERRAAWRAQGRVPDRHEWLELDDGRVADVPREELVDRVAVIMAEERPDVVGTFGPDGITGHPDHVRIGAVTDEAFHRCREREHRSQLPVITDNPHDLATWARRVSREHYVQAWPPREPGSARPGDVFEGLDDPEEHAHRVGARGGR